MGAVALQESSSPPPVPVMMGSPTRARNGVVEGERKGLGIEGERMVVGDEEEEDGGQLDLMG